MSKIQMTVVEAIDIIEGRDEEPASEEETVNAWQYLINTGICWELQGFYSRTATRLIEERVCSAASRR